MKVKKVQIHEFDPVIYPRKLWIVVTDKPKILSDNFDYINDEDNSPFDTSHAFVFNCQHNKSKLKGVCICFTKKATINYKNVSHESVHVASNIFEDCGMSMGFSNGKDEHFAYLVGWIAECCETVKNVKNLTIINKN